MRIGHRRIGFVAQHRKPSTSLIDYSRKSMNGVTPFGNEVVRLRARFTRGEPCWDGYVRTAAPEVGERNSTCNLLVSHCAQGRRSRRPATVEERRFSAALERENGRALAPVDGFAGDTIEYNPGAKARVHSAPNAALKGRSSTAAKAAMQARRRRDVRRRAPALT